VAQERTMLGKSSIDWLNIARVGTVADKTGVFPPKVWYFQALRLGH
jgi:hypothetical protein